MKIKVERLEDKNPENLFARGNVVTYSDRPDLVVMITDEYEFGSGYFGGLAIQSRGYEVGTYVDAWSTCNLIQFHGTITIEV